MEETSLIILSVVKKNRRNATLSVTGERGSSLSLDPEIRIPTERDALCDRRCLDWAGGLFNRTSRRTWNLPRLHRPLNVQSIPRC